ncbi:hypothetical protein GGS20DRAFT_548877 [Poronia punctata]|nr:hypothetical protein GGS20DRAFT_548877 [Poronia punctata]
MMFHKSTFSKTHKVEDNELHCSRRSKGIAKFKRYAERATEKLRGIKQVFRHKSEQPFYQQSHNDADLSLPTLPTRGTSTPFGLPSYSRPAFWQPKLFTVLECDDTDGGDGNIANTTGPSKPAHERVPVNKPLPPLPLEHMPRQPEVPVIQYDFDLEMSDMDSLLEGIALRNLEEKIDLALQELEEEAAAQAQFADTTLSRRPAYQLVPATRSRNMTFDTRGWEEDPIETFLPPLVENFRPPWASRRERLRQAGPRLFWGLTRPIRNRSTRVGILW